MGQKIGSGRIKGSSENLVVELLLLGKLILKFGLHGCGKVVSMNSMAGEGVVFLTRAMKISRSRRWKSQNGGYTTRFKLQRQGGRKEWSADLPSCGLATHDFELVRGRT